MISKILQRFMAILTRRTGASESLGATQREVELARLSQLKARCTLQGLRTLSSAGSPEKRPKLAAISQPQSVELIKRTAPVQVSERCAAVSAQDVQQRKKSMEELLAIGDDYMGGK